MSTINGASSCHQTPNVNRPNNGGVQQGGSYGGVQQSPGVQQTDNCHGGKTTLPPSGSTSSLANQMVASQQLNTGWQGQRDGAVRVAVIDDFTTDGSGFNHGNEIDGIIRSGGAGTAGAVQDGSGVDTVRFNINNGGNRTRNIANSLDQIAQLAAQGQHFDAVNISQQDFANDADTAAVRQKIDLLQRQFGIPVVVAAGNNGQGVRNALAGSAAFVVENSVGGSNARANGSGGGNVRSEGRFTSQAAANVSARVAQLSEMGFSFAQIQQFLQSESFMEGGSLDARFGL